MAKVFFDTNVLIYACDQRDPIKQQIAENLLRSHAEDGTGVVSVQTLIEFFDIGIRKLKLSSQDAKRLANGFLDFELVEAGASIAMEAMDLVTLHSLSIWDAMILAAAVTSKCSVVYSEDMQDGFSIRGTTVRNPFVHAE